MIKHISLSSSLVGEALTICLFLTSLFLTGARLIRHSEDFKGSDSIQIKLYFDEDYFFDRFVNTGRWCAACEVDSCIEGNVILKECNPNDSTQKWFITEDSKITPQNNPSGCLSYRFFFGVSIKECQSSRDDCQLVEVEEILGDTFQIAADNKCIGPRKFPFNIPNYDDRLHLIGCGNAERGNGAYWESGEFTGHTPSARPSATPTSKPHIISKS